MQPHGTLTTARAETKPFAPALAIRRLAPAAPQQAAECQRQADTQQT
jgi:hypothetical protein